MKYNNYNCPVPWLGSKLTPFLDKKFELITKNLTKICLLHWTRGSSVNIVTELRTGRSGLDPRQWHGIFLFATASRPALGSTQLPIQWVSWALSQGIKWPGREADHSSPSSAEVKNAWIYTLTPPYTFMSLYLIKHRIQFHCVGLS
jgi:hypothetical protein